MNLCISTHRQFKCVCTERERARLSPVRVVKQKSRAERGREICTLLGVLYQKRNGEIENFIIISLIRATTLVKNFCIFRLLAG